MKRTVIILSVIFFLISTVSIAQKGNMQMHKGQQDEMCKMLNLSDEQKEKVKELRTAHMKENTEFQLQMKEKEVALQKLITSDNPDMDEVKKLIDEMGAIHTQKMQKEAAHKIAVRKILNDDQKVIFDANDGRIKIDD